MGARLLALQVTVIFLLLATAIKVPVQSNVNLQRAAGLWMPKAGARRGKETTELVKEMEKAPFTLTALSGGKLELVFRLKELGRSTEKKVILEPTKTHGVFSHGADTTISIVEIDYCKYIILFVKKKSFAGIYLFGRDEALGKYLRLKFKELALKMGYPEEQIRDIKSDEKWKP